LSPDTPIPERQRADAIATEHHHETDKANVLTVRQYPRIGRVLVWLSGLPGQPSEDPRPEQGDQTDPQPHDHTEHAWTHHLKAASPTDLRVPAGCCWRGRPVTSVAVSDPIGRPSRRPGLAGKPQ
jgi:hypothetical protein